jgi:hypothetical protein
MRFRSLALSRPMPARDWLLWLPAVVGFAALIVIAVVLAMPGYPRLGDDLGAYLAAGEAFRHGEPIYAGQITEQGVFLYSPIWALLFAPISLLPPLPIHIAIAIGDLICLRYLVGDWRRVGWLFLLPPVIWSVTSGNIDLFIAAAMVLAWRRTAGPLTLLAAAKIAPGLALPIHRWREAALAGVIMLVATFPWLELWVQWFDFLLHQPTEIGLMLSIPWWARLPLALILLVPRRPWTTALAALVAAPGVYWTTSVLLLAPLRLYLDRHDPVLVDATRAEWAHLGWLDRLLGLGTRRRVAELAGALAFVPAHERRESGREALSEGA